MRLRANFIFLKIKGKTTDFTRLNAGSSIQYQCLLKKEHHHHSQYNIN